MKITIGEWKTRDGRKAIVAAYNKDASPHEKYIGWIDGFSYSWDESGFFAPFDSEHENDLISPWTDPVPWDWSATPPWINWIAMDKHGAWYMYPNEPELRNYMWSCGHSTYEGIPQLYAPKWSGDWKLSKTQRPKEVAK